jgi:serine/threonine-protein kinase SRPK3
MIELMGNMPREIALSGKYSSEIFNRKGWSFPSSPLLTPHSLILNPLPFPHSTPGQLRNVHKLRYWGLQAVLHEKYSLPVSEAEVLASFLTSMLRLDPDERAPAGELMHHPWLHGVVVSDTAPGSIGWG